MRTLNNPIFWALGALFVLHQFSQKVLGWSLTFFDHYLDTFLLAPLLLTGLLAEWRDLYQLGGKYTFPLPVVGLLCLVLLITSEVVFPVLSKAFTPDRYDVLSIVLGSCVFYYFLNRPLRISDPAKSSAL
ncbi:MAG: hypothetical protein KTR30_20040 [Saprospiraceae bacterium]|nr:hypothetical protein [Saprospiraceae bacterium]